MNAKQLIDSVINGANPVDILSEAEFSDELISASKEDFNKLLDDYKGWVKPKNTGDAVEWRVGNKVIAIEKLDMYSIDYRRILVNKDAMEKLKGSK